mmetsp:Transcript_8290/g.16342  ORF Transcript_8290/g.16342 Transcript_8290/m.16342 type:complete len:957 (+) Transcript_8290:6396-9266(+)
MDASFETSPLSVSVLVSNMRGVPLLDLSAISMTEANKKLRNSATEAILPKCNWKISKHPRQLFRPKRLVEVPLDTLEIAKKQKTQKDMRVNEIKERLMSTYFKPRAIDRLAEIVSTPNIKRRIKQLQTESIDKMLNHVEATELKAPKHLTIEEIFEKKVRKSLMQSKGLLKTMANYTEAKSIIHATLYKRNRLIEALIDACSNDKARVELVNSIDQFGRTALHYATFLGTKQAMLMLFVAGADPRHRDVYGRTCLHYAVMNEDVTVVEMIFQNMKAVRDTRGKATESSNSNTIAEKFKYLSLHKLVVKSPESSFLRGEDFHEVRICIDLSELDDETLRGLAKMEYSEEFPPTPTFKETRLSAANQRFIDFQDEAGRSALHIASINGFTSVARMLLDMGANPLLEDSMRQRPLELTQSRQLAQLLLQRCNLIGLNKSMTRSSNGSPDTRKRMDVRDLRIMPLEEIHSYTEGELQNTLLIRAVRTQDFEATKILLERGAKVTQTNKNGWSALHYCIKTKQLMMLKLIIEGNQKGTVEDDVMLGKRWIKESWVAMDHSSRQGFTLFHLAAMYCEVEIISYLIDAYERREKLLASHALPEAYANLELKSMKQIIEMTCHGKYSPLLLAIKTCRVEAAKYLTSQGGNMYVRNERLQNALHLSSLHGCQELIEYYVRLDSDRNILRSEKDIKQRKPKDFDITGKFADSFYHIWDFAREGNEIRLRDLITKGRYKVNEATPKMKMTPLHIAVENKQLMIIKILMELGADPQMRNEEGLSSIDLALNYRDSSVETVVLKLMRGNPKSLKANYSEDDLNSFVRQIQRKKLYVPQLTLADHESANQARKRAKREVAVREQFVAVKKKLKERNVSLEELFKMIDKKRSDTLTHVEFEGILLWLGVSLTQKGLRRMIRCLDSASSGGIEFNKLQFRITGQVVEEQEVTPSPFAKSIQSKLLRLIDNMS